MRQKSYIDRELDRLAHKITLKEALQSKTNTESQTQTSSVLEINEQTICQGLYLRKSVYVFFSGLETFS